MAQERIELVNIRVHALRLNYVPQLLRGCMQLSSINRLTLLLALVSLSTLITACSTGERYSNEGDFVLDFYSGTDEVGRESISFDEIIAKEDRPILLNFWAANCPPCRAEMPILEATWREYGDQVLFIGVDVGPHVGLGTYKTGQSLVNEFGITYVTGKTSDRSVITDWKVKNMPSTFLIGKDGQVHDMVIGVISSSRLTQKVRELIAANST
jgi:thiol-disulfide isomerase/thioredoxin